MASKRQPISYKGRSLGILVLVGAQALVGAIHILVGILFLVSSMNIFVAPIVYEVYTLLFGLLVVVFTYLVWNGKKSGWVGTIAISLFVIAADTLALLNLPSIPGIPKSAGIVEISYSVVVIVYLLTARVRKSFFN